MEEAAGEAMSPTPIEIIVSIAIVLLFGAMVVTGVHECDAKHRCTDNGGTVEDYDCAMVPTSCGDNCTMLVEMCDWRCVGASAEAVP